MSKAKETSQLSAPPPAPQPLPPPALAAAAAASGGDGNVTGTAEQLQQFNAWLFRWNNYQQHLATYWQGRYNALYQQTGGGKVKKSKKGKGGESPKEMKWNNRYQELLEFREEHSHVDVPKEFTYKFTPPLGHWVGRQRALHKKGQLDATKIEKLESVGFQWVLKKDDSVKFSVVWDTSYQALKAFKDVNGHIEVPKDYKPSAGSAHLDGWITRQRKHFKDGKLPDHLKDKLLALGLNLGGRGRPFGIQSEDEWSMNYKALAEYCQENGDSDVPEKYDADKQLGIWCKEQRNAYSEGILPENRITMLNQVGFNFYHGRKSAAAKKSDPWQRRISELKAYKAKTGTTNVPKKFELNLGLGDFVYNQRMAYKDKILPEEKIKALEDLEFDWTIPYRQTKKGEKNKTVWETRFEELEDYKDNHGDLNVPDTYEVNPMLAGWAKRQRKYHREGVLKKEKYERLKALGLDFGGPKQEKKPWLEQYTALADFKTEHGHIEVPVSYLPNPSLYYWIGTQKQSYKKGKLSEDKIELLNKIDFDFVCKPRDRQKKVLRSGEKPFLDNDEWEKLFGELVEWKEKNGNCDVPQRSGRLGSWVHYMRFYIKQGKLSQEQIDRLNQVGFTWNVTEDRWMAKYQALSKYKADHGNFDMVASNPIYNWVTYQRKLYHDGSLPEDRVNLLNEIQFDFDREPQERKNTKKKNPDHWENRFKDLLEFREENGHCKVPPVYSANPALAKWVASQKARHSKGNLPDDKLQRLNEVDFDFGPQESPRLCCFVWPKADSMASTLGTLKVPQIEAVDRESYLEDLWDKSYNELVAYKAHFGHCNIPISYAANPSLGAWAFSQKMAYRKDKLSEDRVNKLIELGFSFGTAIKSAEV